MTDEWVLVTSGHDVAGKTLSQYLLRSAGFEREDRRDSYGESYHSPRHKNIHLYMFDGNLLTFEHASAIFPQADAFIFLSRHMSQSSIPALTCHFTGNFSADDSYGGYPRQLGTTYPSLLKGYLNAIVAVRHEVPEYEVTIEATHHGPTSLNKPLMFIELGSSEKQWRDENAAGVICDALLDTLANGFERSHHIGIALGGTHYPQKFNKLLLNSKFALASVVSKYNLEAIDQAMLYQMIEKSAEKVTHVVLDIKGLGSEKDRIFKILDKTPLEVYRV
ncbi:MAG TPA: D-aminoacyl-tRNA deacylase [Nitrososphaera sp.]|nr:D-aminoacyl-tRNA deacylase [Nitrososphaera sp.]